jgi:cytochrome c biogenesis protein CcdA
VNIIGFVISLVLFVLGLYIMGQAFYVEGAEFPVFIGGILVTSLGIFVPVHILKRIDG